MDEIRKFPRIEMDTPIVLKLSGRIIPCKVRNISSGGALLKVDFSFKDQISSEDLNRQASFKLNIDEKTRLLLEGEVSRIIEKDNQKYIAVIFYNYTESLILAKTDASETENPPK